MKNEMEYALCIKRIICVFLILATVVAYVQIFTGKGYEVKTQSLAINLKTQEEVKETKEVEVKESIEIATNYERKTNTTSRRSEKREIKQEVVEETKYISIEEIKISKNMDLTKICGISKEDFKKLMKDLKYDTSKFFYNNSDIIYDLCQKYQINEIFFCGLIAGESGWNIAQNHRRTCNYISMMSKGKLIKYATPEEGLEAAAKLLHNKYLSENGAFYCGKTLSSVQRYFCPDSSTWVNLVYTCMSKI